MGFLTSFILISLLGFISHYLYRKYGLSKGHLAWISYYTFGVIVFFLVFDIIIYVGLLNFFFPLFFWTHIENGKDFMWNSLKLIGIDWRINFSDPGLNNIAIILFLNYPIWFLAFKDFSRKWFGGNRNRPFERGMIYLFSRVKKQKKNQRISLPEKS